MKNILNWLDNNLEEYLCVLLMSVSTIIIFIQVIMRYIFHSSLTWSEEFARYCFIWLIFIANSYACKRRAHIKIEAALKLFPQKVRPYVVIIGELFTIILAVYIFKTGISLVQFQITYNKISPALGVPMWAVYMALVVGFGLMLIREIQTVWLRIRELGKEEE